MDASRWLSCKATLSLHINDWGTWKHKAVCVVCVHDKVVVRGTKNCLRELCSENFWTMLHKDDRKRGSFCFCLLNWSMEYFSFYHIPRCSWYIINPQNQAAALTFDPVNKSQLLWWSVDHKGSCMCLCIFLSRMLHSQQRRIKSCITQSWVLTTLLCTLDILQEPYS